MSSDLAVTTTGAKSFQQPCKAQQPSISTTIAGQALNQQAEVKQCLEQETKRKAYNLSAWIKTYNHLLRNWSEYFIGDIFSLVKDKDGNNIKIDATSYTLSLDLEETNLILIFTPKKENLEKRRVILKIEEAVNFFSSLEKLENFLKLTKEKIECEKLIAHFKKQSRLITLNWFKHNPHFNAASTFKTKELKKIKGTILKLRTIFPDCHIDYHFLEKKFYRTEEGDGKLIYLSEKEIDQISVSNK